MIVVSYNLLSQAVATPQHYKDYDNDVLDFNKRLELIKLKLTKYINDSAIICLQEVTLTFLNSLIPFFDSVGYKFIATNYGNVDYDSIGIGIAYPDNFLLENVNIKTISTRNSNRAIALNFLGIT